MCGATIAKNSTGHHLIPTYKGGPNSVENYSSLCRPCNSSKGTKDMVEWWISKGKTIDQLDLDVVVAYARFVYRMMGEATLLSVAPAYYEIAVRQAATTMSSQLSIYFLENSQ
jgi:hypothetical protein